MMTWIWAPERRQIFSERDVLIPTRHDRDPRRAAAHRQLSIPLADVLSRAGESLSAAGSRNRLTPRITASSSAAASSHVGSARAGRALQRPTESDPASHTAITTTRRPSRFASVRLHGHPSAAPRVLHDVLARFGQRHREAHVALRRDAALRENLLRLLLNAPDDVVHVSLLATGVISSSTLDSPRLRRSRILAVQIEHRSACWKNPVRAQYDAVSSFSGTANVARSARVCAERQQRREPIRRCPPRMAGIDEHLFIAGERGHLIQHLLDC